MRKKRNEKRKGALLLSEEKEWGVSDWDQKDTMRRNETIA